MLSLSHTEKILKGGYVLIFLGQKEKVMKLQRLVPAILRSDRECLEGRQGLPIPRSDREGSEERLSLNIPQSDKDGSEWRVGPIIDRSDREGSKRRLSP